MILNVSFQHVKRPSCIENWRAEASYLVRILRVLATAGLIALGACKTTYLEQPTDQQQNAADIVRAADLRPRSPEQTGAMHWRHKLGQILFVLRLGDIGADARAQRARARLSRGCGRRRRLHP